MESNRKRPAEAHAEGRRHEPAPRHTPKGGSKGSNKGSGKNPSKYKRGGGKGSNKGGGKGSNKGCASKTKDGQDIFFRFNSEQGCDMAKCRGSKGLNKGSGKARGCASKTNDGQDICFRFNSEQGCDMAKCRFVHVCGVCFAKGVPMHSCLHTK